MSAALLTAILGTGWKASIAFTADSFVTVVSLGQQSKSGVVHSSSQAKNQMKSGLLLDIVIRESAAVFELLSSENQTLLIRRNSFLILNLYLDVVNGVTGLDIERDGLARQSLDEDLHGERVVIDGTSTVQCRTRLNTIAVPCRVSTRDEYDHKRKAKSSNAVTFNSGRMSQSYNWNSQSKPSIMLAGFRSVTETRDPVA